MPLRMRNSGLSDTLVLSDNVGYDAMHSVVKIAYLQDGGLPSI